MADFLVILLVAFILFGFLRRFIYFQAFRSFTKAAEDFQRRQQSARKPEGTVTIDTSVKKKKSIDEGEFVDYEEVK